MSYNRRGGTNKHLNLCGSLIVVGSTVQVQVEGRRALARRVAHLTKGRRALYNTCLPFTLLQKDCQQNIPYMTPLGLHAHYMCSVQPERGRVEHKLFSIFWVV
jgi:hypothetical protein